jgi:hypothetical protein
MIQAMLPYFLKYENLKLIPNENYINLNLHNNKLLIEIKKLTARLKTNKNLFSIAEKEYKSIINKININLLRTIMYEQKIRFYDYDDILFDFSINDDDIGLKQNILLKRLIEEKKMRNIIKYLILKKYCSKLNSIKSSPSPSPKPPSPKSPPSSSLDEDEKYCNEEEGKSLDEGEGEEEGEE